MTVGDSHVERAISAPAAPTARRRPPSAAGRPSTRVCSAWVCCSGPANVIMQLARPGVGYGVLESRVESGRVDRHPIKRARTTFTYLAVAGRGSDEQKAAFRRAVNRAHAQVYSTDESPVKYNAFDKDLQMWVAACLYKGAVDSYRIFVGEMDDETADRHYAEGMYAGHHAAGARRRCGPPTARPSTSTGRSSSTKVHIDDTVREYLYPIAASRIRGVTLPGPLQRRIETSALLITTGFLPQRFRDEMRLPWDARRQRRFDRLMAAAAAPPPTCRRASFGSSRSTCCSRISTGGSGPAARWSSRLQVPGVGELARMRSDGDTWDITDERRLDGPVRRRGKGTGGAEARAAGGRSLRRGLLPGGRRRVGRRARRRGRRVATAAQLLDGDFGEHFVSFQGARTKYFDAYFAERGRRRACARSSSSRRVSTRGPTGWPGPTARSSTSSTSRRCWQFKRDVLADLGDAPRADRREVAVDLRDDWPRALATAGSIRPRPSAWIAEGLLIYLPAAAQEQLFAGIDALSAPAAGWRSRRAGPCPPQVFEAKQAGGARRRARTGTFFTLIYNEQHRPRRRVVRRPGLERRRHAARRLPDSARSTDSRRRSGGRPDGRTRSVWSAPSRRDRLTGPTLARASRQLSYAMLTSPS